MKKSKSLVITSLLFSTMILNPSMINAVVVNAAANNVTAGTTNPNPIPTDTIQGTPDKTTTTITVKFLDSTNNLKKFDEKTIEVPNGTKEVKGSTITAPNGYIVTGRELIEIKNNEILVHIKPEDSNTGHEVSKSDVIVKYINDGKKNGKIPDGVIKDLEDNATSVDKSRVPVPSGYKSVENQEFKVSYGMVKVHVIPVIDKSPTGKPSKPNKKPGHSSSTDTTTYTNKVQFIDQATNKEIGAMKVSGLNGSKHKLVIPEGYELVRNEASEVKIDKSQKAYHVTVIKKNVTVVKPTVTAHKTTFRTNKTTQLFNIEGKAVRNRALMANTSWAVDKQMTLNGTTYYRVATNEWVKVSDGAEITITESAVVNRTVRTSGNSAKRLYTSTGQLVGNRALAANTPWFSDKSAVINGQKMYRVATNEWVSANDLA